MTLQIKLGDTTIHRVVEQEGAWFDAFQFFPGLTKELFEENRSWLEPKYFIDNKIFLCVQSYLVRTRTTQFSSIHAWVITNRALRGRCGICQRAIVTRRISPRPV